MDQPTRPIGAAAERWIEVEPGAPLPPEVPPWARRHALVPMTELPASIRAASLAIGGASLLATVVALALGDPRGYAGILPAAVFLYAGITGGHRFEGLVPDPDGRYVLAQPAPEPDPPAYTEAVQRAKKAGRRSNAVFTVSMVLIAMLAISNGISLREVSVLLAVVGMGALPLLIDRWKRGRESEAIASDQFRRLSDPRQALADPAAPSTVQSLPAGASDDGASAFDRSQDRE